MIGHRVVGYLALATLPFTALLGISCSRQPCSCSDERDQAAPVDPALIAFLSRARAAHHLADLREDGEPSQAVAALVGVVTGPVPQTAGTVPPEAREVIADTQARIADLQSRQKQFEDALKRIASALEQVPEVSYFRGHLFEVRGLVEQRQASELLRLGQREQAEKANTRALQAFEMAMQVQAEVIRNTPAQTNSSAGGKSGAANDSKQ